MKIKDINLQETTTAGSIAIGAVGSIFGSPIKRTKKKKDDKNPSIYGGAKPKNELFAGGLEEGIVIINSETGEQKEVDKETALKAVRAGWKIVANRWESVEESTKPNYKNKQVKGKSPMPKLTKPTAGHESPHPFRGKLVGEDAVDEALPSHLAKFFDKEGNLKPEVSNRMSKNKDYKIKDVTPKGYGPGNHYEIGGDRYDGGIVFKVYIGGDEVHSDIIDGDHPYVYNGKKYDGVMKALDAIAKDNGLDNADDFKRVEMEGSIPDDKKNGIKWADDPDWKKLHDMDIDMVKDFISHKEEAENIPEKNDFDMDAEIASYGDDSDDDNEEMSDAPYAIVWHGQYAEWYGDGDPKSGKGRYKMKGDAGNVLAKNIPTHAQAEKLLPRVAGMGHVGERGKWGEDHSVVMQASDPMIVPMKELGDHFYGYDTEMNKYGSRPEEDDHHDVIDLAGVEERKLSGAEKKNKEHNVKKLKKSKDSFSKYGKDAESVMYAVATRDAKKGKKYK